MRIYPAIRAQMGNWQYYIVRMKMREIAHEVKLAHDVYADKTLSDAIQRVLGENRVKSEIVGYLARQPDRFFSSIVVAAMEGEPIWHPVEMDDTVPKIFTSSSSLRDSFGVLSFGDDPKYYALDGQHRVAAIKLLVNGEANVEVPQGFDDDLLSVIVVLREEHDVPDGEWMKRYRRLFSSLNRYAKPTDKDTNIIMDEDDLFAIVTRRLITEHEFFQAPGPERQSFKVRTKGKNVRAEASHFTTLQALYSVNKVLLSTRRRENRGWSSDGTRLDVQTRPDEDDLDRYYEELTGYWDAILEAIPTLRCPPQEMRVHDSQPRNSKARREGSSDENYQDHLLFWPIGQEYLLSRLVRGILDRTFPDHTWEYNVDEMTKVLRPLAQVPWELHGAPWRYLLLVPVPERDSWRMRNEERKEALALSYRLLRWIVGLDSLNKEEEEELRQEWQSLLLRPEPVDTQTVEEMWQEIVDVRANIVTGN